MYIGLESKNLKEFTVLGYIFSEHPDVLAGKEKRKTRSKIVYTFKFHKKYLSYLKDRKYIY